MAMTERAAVPFVSENTAGGSDPAAVRAVDEEQSAVAPKPEERTRERAGEDPDIPSVESSRDGCVNACGLTEPERRIPRAKKGSAI